MDQMGVVPWGQTDVCSGGDRCHHRGRAIAAAPGDTEDDVTDAIVNAAIGEPTSERLINSLWGGADLVFPATVPIRT